MSISTRAAADAAWRAGADLGFSGDDPVVLHDGGTVVVHLRLAPVVAREANRTALIRPVAAWLARDVMVARHVALADYTGPLPAPGPVDNLVNTLNVTTSVTVSVTVSVLERSATAAAAHAGGAARVRDGRHVPRRAMPTRETCWHGPLAWDLA